MVFHDFGWYKISAGVDIELAPNWKQNKISEPIVI